MLMIGQQMLLNLKMIEQFDRMAGILRGDHVHFLQNPESPQRNILKITDGCSDNV